MRVNLPVDLLRTFVTIVETGSIVKASEHIFLTQSALSLQMKRLADIIEQPIFKRFQNTTNLTPAGHILLDHARKVLALNDSVVAQLGGRIAGPIRIGMAQDFADVILSTVLSRFKRSNPDIQLTFKIASSSELREMLDAGLLDIALYLGEKSNKDTVVEADVIWLGDPELLVLPTLPVALMSKPCLFRDCALNELDKNKVPYTIVIESPSTSVLRAAVESGIAVTNRTHAFMGNKFSALDIGLNRPQTVTYDLGIADTPHPATQRLAELIRAAIKVL